MRSCPEMVVGFLTQNTSGVIHRFVDYFCIRDAPLLNPLPLGEGLGEGAAGGKYPSPSPSPPHRRERKLLRGYLTQHTRNELRAGPRARLVRLADGEHGGRMSLSRRRLPLSDGGPGAILRYLPRKTRLSGPVR